MFLVAALIWLLLLLPPAVMMAYFSILLHPSVAVMTRPHTVTFDRNRLRVDFPSESDDESDSKEGDVTSDLCQINPIIIEHTEIKSIDEVSRYIVVIWCKSRRLKILLIPVSQIHLGLADFTWS